MHIKQNISHNRLAKKKNLKILLCWEGRGKQILQIIYPTGTDTIFFLKELWPYLFK